MSVYDDAGRIHKRAFLLTLWSKVSNLVLFSLCMVSACARYYIRIYVQKQFTSDDGILLFGLMCLIAAISVLLNFIDQMYVVGTSESGNLVHVSLPSNFIEQAYFFQKMVTVSLVLTWCSIVAVKFSYLFLFKRLVKGLPQMVTYWWIAAIYNAMISLYGGIVYGVACPNYYSLKSLQCAFGEGLYKAIAFSESQMALDIVGDLLIIAIPVRLIWSIKIRRTQKIALASTLCLTILTILCTIVRMAGIRTGRVINSIDSVWETYWQFVAAEIALTMTAATAFRTIFVSRGAEGRRVARAAPELDQKGIWYTKSRKFLHSILSTRLWYSWRSRKSSGTRDDRHGDWEGTAMGLRQEVPRATMTGMRTFIDRYTASHTDRESQSITSAGVEELQDDWLLSTSNGRAAFIRGNVNV
ncbi:MAG: hypothetical protein Q9178_003037 [Gyalolechia marmorata]